MAIEGRHKFPSLLVMASEERHKSLLFLVLYVCSIGGALAPPMTPSEGVPRESSRLAEAHGVGFVLLGHTVGLSMHLFLQAHSHKWNTKEELGKDKRETPTRQRLLVVVGTEIFTIATPARGVVIFIRVNLATRPPTITTDVSVDLAKHGALAS